VRAAAKVVASRRRSRKAGRGNEEAGLKPRTLLLSALAGLALAACSGESRSTAAPVGATVSAEPRIVNLEELAAAVKQNLGRGALVNVWATW